MAISPINSVSFKNNYNLSFEGNKKKNHAGNHPVSSPYVKAVPLAVLLAMSPLNETYAQKKQFTDIDKKVYSGVLADNRHKSKDLTVKFVDSDGDLSTVEHVNFQSEHAFGKLMNKEPLNRYDIYGSVKSLTDYQFNIIGDDGKAFGTLGYSQIMLDDNREVSLSDVVQDMRHFAQSPRNNAFRINKVNVDLIPAKDGSLKTFIPNVTDFDTNWIKKVKEKDYDFGTKIMTGNITTKKGNYKIEFYSNNGDNSDFETIVMERDDGLKFKLDGRTQLNLMFATSDGNKEEQVTLGLINISWPGVGKYSIFDGGLYNQLEYLTKDSKFNNAFEQTVIDKKVSVTPSGILSNIEEKIYKMK